MLINSKIFWTYSFSFVLINQIIRILFFSKFLNSEDFSSTSSLNIFLCFSSGILSLSILKSFLISLLDSASCFPWFSIPFICFMPWYSIAFVCFSKAFPKYENLACSIICLWLQGNISLHVRYIYQLFQILMLIFLLLLS